MRLPALIALALIMATAWGQVDDQRIRREVLQLGVPDSTCTFGKWTLEGGTETHLTYLGEVRTTRGTRFKFLCSTWIWGHGMRATNRILIYTDGNVYVGQYQANTVNDLPVGLRNGSLLFRHRLDAHCTTSEETVDLTHGLPERFVLRCSGEFIFE